MKKSVWEEKRFLPLLEVKGSLDLWQLKEELVEEKARLAYWRGRLNEEERAWQTKAELKRADGEAILQLRREIATRKAQLNQDGISLQKRRRLERETADLELCAGIMRLCRRQRPNEEKKESRMRYHGLRLKEEEERIGAMFRLCEEALKNWR